MIVKSVNSCRTEVLSEARTLSRTKMTMLQAQSQDLLEHLTTLEVHHGQVSALLAHQDYARAILATIELKKVLEAMQRAHLAMHPVT